MVRRPVKPALRVLSVTPEAVPLIKTGGLADVAGALPSALVPFGVDMRTLLPGYPRVMAQLSGRQVVADLPDCIGGPARVLAASHGGMALFVLDAPQLYDRAEGGPYLNEYGQDWPDNAERFAALSWAAARIAGGAVADWAPDLVHVHDWQGALAPYYIARGVSDRHVPSVLTIHNIAFQGLAPATKLDALRLRAADFHPDGIEYWGKISALKTGLTYADRLTTVSPTYAAELMTPQFGMGLEGVLQGRRKDLVGILNGIDLSVWSPEADSHIIPYDSPDGKAANKAALRAELGLPDADGPLCVVVSRLTHQKGLDLLLGALVPLLERGAQLAVLGAGDAELEHAYLEAAVHPNIAVAIGYDEWLSHRMMAGGDAILVPSRFEPCGLTQMYGLRYGTLPVVALTGGLADTIIPVTPATMAVEPLATGFQFSPTNVAALTNALMRMCDLYAQPKVWDKLQRNAMAHPVGWDHSAAEYAALYQDVTAVS